MFGTTVTEGCSQGNGTDNWQCRANACYFDSTGFCMLGPGAVVDAVGSWLALYRPTKVMFVVNGVVPSITLFDHDGEIARATNYVPGTPIDIVGQVSDIWHWDFDDWFSHSFTDIWFYSP